MVELHPSHLENAKTAEHWQGFLKLDRINISTFATMLVVGVYSQDGKDPNAEEENFKLEVDWVLYLLLGGTCKGKIKPFGEVKGLEELERAYMDMTSFLAVMRRDNKPCAYAQKLYGMEDGETLARIGRDPKQDLHFLKLVKELGYARQNVQGVVDPVEALSWLCSKDDATDYIPSILLQCWHEFKAEQARTVQEKEQSEPPKPCPKKEHKPISIEKAALILKCSGSTIKRYDRGEGTLAEYYPGRNSIITLQQFAATLRAHKAQRREARAIRNAQRGYDIDEL